MDDLQLYYYQDTDFKKVILSDNNCYLIKEIL